MGGGGRGGGAGPTLIIHKALPVILLAIAREGYMGQATESLLYTAHGVASTETNNNN